jgi:Protein of unknown function (DUF1761)
MLRNKLGENAMNFAVNYLAVIVAAVVAVAINALWYNVIFKAQVNALRAADPTIAGRDPVPPMYGVAIVGQLLLSFVIAVVIKSTGVTGIGGVVLAGSVLWLGLSLPPIAQILIFGYRNRQFVVIDGGVWLLNALVIGAIHGLWP